DTPPTVTTTTPTNGATSVLATVHPSVTFNKAVTATNTAFKLECPTGTSVTFTVSPSGPGAATTFTLTPSADLPAGVVCTVTAVASQIADSAGTNMAADFSFSFTVDTPPTVIGNTPANNATDVPLATTITVTFSKAVSVTAGGFTLECPSGTAETFTVSPALPGPGTTFTLTPSSALPSFTNCAVTVVASHVTDAPGTAMVANFGFTFQTAAVPTVVPQSFSGAIGNTTLGVGAAPSQPSTSTTGNVLTGDTNGGAGTLAAVTSGNPITTANGGSVTMNSDGTFVYQPPAGFVGNDTFTYVVTNGLHTASSTVTITVANRVWYVNSASGTNGNGTSTSPFNVLSSAQSASAAGDFIFLYGSATNYSGGITLKATQTLLGQSVGLVVSGHTLVTASGSNPTITNSGGAGITLGEGDTVNGITVSGTSGAGITASSVNGATIGSSVTVTGSTGDGIDITGGNGTFSVGTTITTSSAHSVNVQSRSGGTTTFSGPITDPGTGLLLNSNSGATINFTGTISATTGTHQAFTATAGGTVSATGSGSTLTTTSADALVVSSTTIGSGNLNFKSISSNGATDGISLTSTGTSGGLTVTGNGSPATGGTIQNSTGAGVYADSAANINLSWMNIANNGSANNSGIGFDNGGDGVKLDNISGTGHLTSSTVTGSNVNNVEIHNNSATLSAFTIQGPSCSITNNNTTNGDVGIQVLAENTGVITATVDSCNLSGNRSDAIQGNAASGTASLTMTVTNNTIVAGTGGANQGNIGIDVVGAAATTLGYTISGNKVGTPDGTTDAHLINDGINVFTAGTSSSAVGTITNNIVFGPGAGVSGIPIRVITGTTSTGRSRVQGNTVHGLGFDPGILVQVGQNAGSTAHGDMGVFNNTVDNPPATTGDVGINVETADAGVGCFSVTGNVKGQTGGSFQDLNVVAAGTSTFDVAGATLGSITAATVQSYEAAHNFQTGPAGVVVAAKATTASFVGVASTACNIP
ncbi:MAG TPA: Ig-like domain-containing protein, partial [Acidimicrobiales bacterium]|nr:Ig-like domain-containing protein [Acidimicrobiales bacterium]